MPKNEYFKGWYFKCSGEKQTAAFIPSFHFSGKKSSFLQIITDDKAFCLSFPKMIYREKPLFVKIGNSVFSEEGIKLDIRTDNLTAQGALRFGELAPIRYDIMGPFKFVPFMQCRHSIYSMSHRIDGRITINGKLYVFHDSAGYIEGDCGTSFPKRYVWTQCHFANGSLMLSVADIPIFGFGFTGIIGIVMLNGKEHRIATYLGARLKNIGKNSISVSQSGYELTAKLIRKNAHPLSAPVNGKMNRTIHESASCTAFYRFSYKGTIICEFTSDRASFEFEYQ